MADKEQGVSAENKKSSWLQEVEDEAVYLTKKRFAEAEEEKKRAAEKEKRQNGDK